MKLDKVLKNVYSIERLAIKKTLQLAAFLVAWFLVRFERCYRFLVTHEKILLVFLFILVLLSRGPWLLFIALDDPGDDSAFYINIGKNVAEGDGYSSDFKETFYDRDGKDNNTDIDDQAFMIPPVYPAFLAIGFLLNYSALTAKVIQTLLFGVFICVYYIFVKACFDRKIAFFSSLLLVFDPLLFQNSVQPMTDIMSLLLMVSVLYFIKLYEEKENVKYVYYAGIATAIAFLTREPNLIIFLLISGIMVHKKKYKIAALFAVAFFVIILPWYFYQLIDTGYILPRLHVGKNFPGSPITPHLEKRSTIINVFLFAFREVYTMIVHDYFLSGVFVIFLPFIILGVIKYIISPKKSYICTFLFSILIVIFYFGGHILLRGGHAGYRYYFPPYIFFLPLGLGVFFDYAEHLGEKLKSNILHLNINANVILTFFVACSILISSGTIIMKAYDIKTNEYDDSKNYEWLKNNATKDGLIATTNPQRCTYFTDLKCIRLPRNVDDFYLEEFISFYNVSYLFIKESYDPGFDFSYNWVTQVFNGTQIISLHNYNLMLVFSHKQPQDFGYAWTYEVEKIQN